MDQTYTPLTADRAPFRRRGFLSDFGARIVVFLRQDYNEHTWAEDKVPQECDPSAGPSAGTAWAVSAPTERHLTENTGFGWSRKRRQVKIPAERRFS